MNKIESIGLIAEFNPFHEGHLAYVNHAKELNKDAVLVCAMSPNFVQRGEPAIYSKERRVKDALKNGIDLIVEIPTIFAVESADIYANSALDILNKMQVSELIFGTESGDTKEFLDKYNKGLFSSPRMDDLIQDFLDQGESYASAKSKAMLAVNDYYLETPNDILGYEYLRCINEKKYPIKINCYKRINDEKDPQGTSAFAIRTKLKKYGKNRYNFNFLDKYFDLLKYRLTAFSNKELSQIHLIDEGIENLFIKNIYKASTMDEFIELSTSKRYSRARIKRSIIHILLNTKKDEANDILKGGIPYIRVLGFNSRGAKYLRYLKKNFEINLVTRFSAQDNTLLLNELKASSLYFSNVPEPRKSQLIQKEMTAFPIRKK